MYADCTKCLIIEACKEAYGVMGDPPCSIDKLNNEERLAKIEKKMREEEG